ncbi:MAG: hypothetical protein LCH41_03260 [Armatimonadetes bacterium]|nr:hypothetical protein [Armatimonadota bacterium]
MSLLACLYATLFSPTSQEPVRPVRSEVITPIRNVSFDKGGTAKKRVQGGNPRRVGKILLFDGSQDGNRQVDPQIAVGGGYVLHGTNSGIVIYDKSGNYIDGVPQSEFNDGIDPKLFYCPHNKVFGFDLWNPWDAAKKKPVNISVSERSDPRRGWNTYPVPAPNGVDGGGIGYSRKWIGYSFPGGSEQTFVMPLKDAKEGKPTKVFHFKGSLGHPVATQDPMDDLYFVTLTDQEIILKRVGDDGSGTPVILTETKAKHGFKNFGWPPQSPMKGTDKKTASGDRNPKNLVIQGKHLWFSHTVNVNGRAGVQWHQFGLDGSLVQTGLLAHAQNSYIQTTLAVNKRLDVLVGFQETGPGMFISGRAAIRRFSDPKGTLREIIRLGEGVAATEGGAWGDYSGSVVDGDNLTDLWTIQSVANAQGRGGTVIAKIPAP